MSRTTRSKTKIWISAVVVVVLAIGLGSWAYIANSPEHKVQTVVNAQHHITQISYQGQNGLSALTLLQRHSTIKTKHYSFGDLVTSINGTAASGSKYWIFYVNGKEAKVGAGAYITKNSDTLTWKLQS